MMTELLAGVELLAVQEKARAGQHHCPVFTSPHEAYGVIAEELMEARTEVSCLSGAEQTLLRVIHKDDRDLYRATLTELRNAAQRAAAELVQVVAMCDKALDSDNAAFDPVPLRDVARRNAERYRVYVQGDWGPGE